MKSSREWHWQVEQMLSLIRAGIVPDATLGMAAQKTGKAKILRQLGALQKDVSSGARPAIQEIDFRKGPVSLLGFALRRGKDTGNYVRPLETLATYLKTDDEVQSSILRALMLPLFFATLVLGLLYGFAMCVAPLSLSSFAREFEIPASGVIKVWAFLTTYYVPIGLAVLLIMVIAWTSLIKIYLGKPAGRYIDWVRMYLPVFGRIYISVSRERFNGAAAFLIQNDVPLLDSFRLAAPAARNTAFECAVITAMDHAAAHAPLLECLRNTGVFDEAFCWLAANAEMHGDAKNLLPLLLPRGDVAAQLARRWRPQFLEPAVSTVAFLFVFAVAAIIVASVFRLGGG